MNTQFNFILDRLLCSRSMLLLISWTSICVLLQLTNIANFLEKSINVKEHGELVLSNFHDTFSHAGKLFNENNFFADSKLKNHATAFAQYFSVIYHRRRESFFVFRPCTFSIYVRIKRCKLWSKFQWNVNKKCLQSHNKVKCQHVIKFPKTQICGLISLLARTWCHICTCCLD